MTGQGSSNNSGSERADTSGSATTSDDDETGGLTADPAVPVDSSTVASPSASEDESEQDLQNYRSALQDSSVTGSQDGNSAATTIEATQIVVSSSDDDDTTVTVTNTGTPVANLPLSLSVNLDDNQSTVVVDSGDPLPTMTAIDLESDLVSWAGLSTDGPVAPALPGVVMGSLDLVRRDLEQMADDQSGDAPQITTTALVAEAPPDWTVPDELTMDPTAAERTTAFQKAQAKRIETFNEAQAARIEAFNEQLASQSAENPLGALVSSAAFVVSELVNTAAVVVTEFVNYISFAVTEFIQGLSDWFTTPAVFTGLYGDPTTNAQYWQAQSSQNCVLMSTAMIINQLKGTPNEPDEDAIVEEAQQTDSVANPGRKMYQGLQSQDGVDVKDALKLLENHGISATLTSYDKSEGNLALRAVAFALDEKKAVSVGLHGGTIWAAVEGGDLPQGASAADHQVVVTGIDFTERVVYLNDSGFAEQGKNMKVPLDAFMKAWQTDDYETIIAELKPVEPSASGPASANISGSGVLVSLA